MDNEIYTFIIKGLNQKICLNVPGNTTISQLFEKYLERIQKKNLLINNIDNIFFVFNARKIELDDKKRVDEFFTMKYNDIVAENSYNAKFNVEIIKPIKENIFTSVFKGKIEDEKGVHYYAVKKIFKDIIKKEIKLEQGKKEITEKDFEPEIKKFNKEIKNMEKCWCQNSVEIYDYFDTKDEFIIVMELCDDNLLRVLSKQPKGSGLSPIEIKRILLQLNNVFKLMNTYKISHRDIKLANILVKYDEKNNYRVLLSDYGISNQLSLLTTKFMTHAGTALTMAPEILSNEKYDDKCDLWSLGVVIFQLYARKYPYKGVCESDILKKIEKDGQSVLDEIKDEQIKDLLSKLLVRDPKKRISWEEYYKHPFFQEN